MIPREYVVGQVNISGVAPDSPAELAGLESGDLIISINGKKILA